MRLSCLIGMVFGICVAVRAEGQTPVTPQKGDPEVVIDSLIKLGFENVRWTEDEEERIYALENTAYRLSGKGVSVAAELIQRQGLPESKACRIIVVDNNIPQISLLYRQEEDSDGAAGLDDWKVSYELDKGWNKIKKEKKKNSSLFKVDLVVYPEVSFKNLIITQVYQWLVNINPTIEISLWPGMKFAGQIVIPVYNEYGPWYKQVREGFVSLTQTVRLPWNTFLMASVGSFNSERWGVDVEARHFFKDERFSVFGRVGYTGVSYFEDWYWHVSPLRRWTGSLGGSFYWPKYNVQIDLKAEQYLRGDRGVRGDLIRHFRYVSIGFYAMKTNMAPANGGFRFQIALPPYRYKRKYARILPSRNWGLVYNAGNERFYGKTYRTQPGDNIMQRNNYNPYFIKSELLNFYEDEK